MNNINANVNQKKSKFKEDQINDDDIEAQPPSSSGVNRMQDADEEDEEDEDADEENEEEDNEYGDEDQLDDGNDGNNIDEQQLRQLEFEQQMDRIADAQDGGNSYGADLMHIEGGSPSAIHHENDSQLGNEDLLDGSQQTPIKKE